MTRPLTLFWAAHVLALASFVGPALTVAAGASSVLTPVPQAALLTLALALAAWAAGAGLGARQVALLAVLSAQIAALRYVEVAIPGPGEFSPVFAPILLAGYALGPVFGATLGALSLAVSAVITGGLGLWLPFQMAGAGWIGLLSGLLPGAGPSLWPATRRRVAALALWGAACGWLYGLLMNLWAWSFLEGGPRPGEAAGAALNRLGALILTAAPWDAFRALGNLALVLALGGPLLLLLGRAARGWDLPPAAADPMPPEPAIAAIAPGGATRASPAPPGGLHPRAWLAWLFGAVLVVSAAWNPYLLAGLAFALALAGRPAPGREAIGPGLARFAAFVILFSTAYNGLMSHVGATVLAHLPVGWPLVGGPLTAEALAYGALTGIRLALLLLAGAAFQSALGARDLLGLVPRAFGPLALAAGIALSWAPQTRRRLAELAEAQAARGLLAARGRGRRWAALVVPMAADGMERALALADLLAARGLIDPGRRGPPATRRVPRAWTRADGLTVLGALVPAALLMATPAWREAAAWSPYPELGWPQPAGMALVAALGLAAPAFLGRRARAAPLLPADTKETTVTLPIGSAARILGPDFRASGFGLKYPDRPGPALSGLTFELPAGRICLVTGHSGAGKSTLLRAFCGLAPQTTGGRAWGELRLGDIDPTRHTPGAMGRRIGLVPGDPEQGFVVDHVADEVAFALEQAGVPPPEVRRRVAESLELLGIAGLAERDLGTLSGGQAQRVAIASALALAPRALALDEPTSQLDDAAAEAVLDALHRLADRGTSILISEHRLDRLAGHAEWRLHLPPGGGAVAGPAAEVDASVGRSDWAIGPPPPASPGPALLRLLGVTFRRGDKPILDAIDLELRAGELCAVAGPSGVGKTTLLRLAAGLAEPTAGTVECLGAAAMPAGRVYLPQDPGRLLVASTAREELLYTLRAHGLPPRTPFAPSHDPDRLLDVFGIGDLADAHPRDLSTGQRQRLALAALLVLDPALILLDEPTRGLDDASLAGLVELLQRMCADGRAVLLATHDRRLMAGMHRVLRLAGDPEAGVAGQLVGVPHSPLST